MPPPPIQSFPITLTPAPVPVGITANNLNELLTAICQYVSGAVQANVSFFQTFVGPPSYFAGNIIFVTGLNNFMVWSTSSGSYQLLTQLEIGSVVQRAVIYGAPSFDDLVGGWIYLNGRDIATISGLSGDQVSNLNAIFPNGVLANVQPLAVFPVGQMAIVGSFTSGPGFSGGETVTQTGSGATGKVYQDQGPGITNLIILEYTGTAALTGVWTGGGSGSVFTPDGIHGIIPYYGPELVISRVYCGTNIPSV